MSSSRLVSIYCDRIEIRFYRQDAYVSTFQRGVEQLSPLSVFRPDDFSTKPQLTSPCDTLLRNDKSCSAGLIRAASWPSFCFVFLTGRQLRLISRSATVISSGHYDRFRNLPRLRRNVTAIELLGVRVKWQVKRTEKNTNELITEPSPHPG